ncbi:hypothetical protein OF83DRAFT_1088291 [Amylostereum chailletii]|nr:hypothetical protein OF83DRAFT_1088291 [Amylostereum chailletii]
MSLPGLHLADDQFHDAKRLYLVTDLVTDPICLSPYLHSCNSEWSTCEGVSTDINSLSQTRRRADDLELAIASAEDISADDAAQGQQKLIWRKGSKSYGMLPYGGRRQTHPHYRSNCAYPEAAFLLPISPGPRVYVLAFTGYLPPAAIPICSTSYTKHLDAHVEDGRPHPRQFNQLSPSNLHKYTVFAQEESPDAVFAREESPDAVFVREESPDAVFAREESPDAVFAREEPTRCSPRIHGHVSESHVPRPPPESARFTPAVVAMGRWENGKARARAGPSDHRQMQATGRYRANGV